LESRIFAIFFLNLLATILLVQNGSAKRTASRRNYQLAKSLGVLGTTPHPQLKQLEMGQTSASTQLRFSSIDNIPPPMAWATKEQLAQWVSNKDALPPMAGVGWG